MPTTTKIVDPAGAGDYLSLSAAALGEILTTGTVHLTCRKGNIGAFSPSDLAGMACDTIEVVGEVGSRTDGTDQSSANVATITSQPYGPNGTSGPRTLLVDGIRIEGVVWAVTVSAGSASPLSYTFQNCYFKNVGDGIYLDIEPDASLTVNLTVQDCCCFQASGAALGFLLGTLTPMAGTLTVNADISHCSCYAAAGTTADGISFTGDQSNGGTLVLNTNVRDCAVVGVQAGRCFVFEGDGTHTPTGGYNLASDTSAAVFGATGAINSATPATEYGTVGDFYTERAAQRMGTGVAITSATDIRGLTFSATKPNIGASSNGELGAAAQLAADKSTVANLLETAKASLYPNAATAALNTWTGVAKTYTLRASNIGTLAGTDNLTAGILQDGKTVDNVAGTLDVTADNGKGLFGSTVFPMAA